MLDRPSWEVMNRFWRFQSARGHSMAKPGPSSASSSRSVPPRQLSGEFGTSSMQFLSKAMEHAFLRLFTVVATRYQLSSCQPLRASFFKELSVICFLGLPQLHPSFVLLRYQTDFEEIKRLGRGGFGVVVSAINRLDGRTYAIKKIKLMSSSSQSYSRIVREVSTLSRLQHPHVVRYFQVGYETT